MGEPKEVEAAAMVNQTDDQQIISGVIGEEKENGVEEIDGKFSMKNFLWHGGSVYDAWFSCASNQVILIFFLQEIIFASTNSTFMYMIDSF